MKKTLMTLAFLFPMASFSADGAGAAAAGGATQDDTSRLKEMLRVLQLIEAVNDPHVYSNGSDALSGSGVKFGPFLAEVKREVAGVVGGATQDDTSRLKKMLRVLQMIEAVNGPHVYSNGSDALLGSGVKFGPFLAEVKREVADAIEELTGQEK